MKTMNVRASDPDSSIEPGLKNVFRLFLSLRLLSLILFFLPTWLTDPATLIIPYRWLAIAGTLSLILYLSIPRWQNRLGRAYLPLAFGLALVMPLFEYALFNVSRITSGAADVRQPVFALTIVLILLVWQYRLRTALLVLAGIALVNLAQIVYAARQGIPVAKELVVSFAELFFMLLVSIVVGQIVHTLRAQRNELAEARDRLANYAAAQEQLAITRERNRMALELHDTIAHTLTAAAVQQEAARMNWQTEVGRERLEQAIQATRQGLETLRASVQDLRLSPLEEFGLSRALQHLARKMSERRGLACSSDFPLKINGLSPVAEHHVYRIFQEALTNVERHAEAREIHFSARRDGNIWEFYLEDDGKGFDAVHASQNGHFGLAGMKERADLIGAHLNLQSVPRAGTRLTLSVEAET
jgi:signal transduction histidine kinase